jgi:rod shape-determining protein MreC
MWVNRYFFNREINNIGILIFQKFAIYTFEKLGNTGFIFRNLFNITNILNENEKLTKENLNLLSQLADYENLKNENEFLKKTLNISSRFDKNFTYANIYQFQLGPDGYEVLINKGSDDNIVEGDVVITEEGILVGKIKSVYKNFSKLLIVKDPNFNVTAKVLNSNTSGMAKGALNQGIYLDLITKDDPIIEGDIVVSSGSDLVPPSLIIGTVIKVEENETDLFKKIKIQAAIDKIKIGKILIIKNR